MSVVLPLFTSYAITFFEKPSFKNWSILFFLLVASAGLSPMVSWFMLFGEFF